MTILLPHRTRAPGRARGPGRPTRWWALAVGLACTAGVLALHTVTTTRTGARADRSALDAVLDRVGSATATARDVLALTSEATVLLVLAGIVGVALLRRRPDLAVGAAVVVLASSGTTALVKAITGGSLPSGHVTAVAGLGCAALLVLPARARPVAAVLAGGAVLAQGTATMIAGWHLPSDVLAGVLVALGWTAAVVLAAPSRAVGATR